MFRRRNGEQKKADSKQYTAAVKSSSLDSVAKAISSLSEVYHRDPKLATILEAPTLSVEDKSQIVAELQKHTGGADKEGTVKNFLSTLAEYNRLGLLKNVCERFGDLMAAARGEIELTVTSASVSAGTVRWAFPTMGLELALHGEHR